MVELGCLRNCASWLMWVTAHFSACPSLQSLGQACIWLGFSISTFSLLGPHGKGLPAMSGDEVGLRSIASSDRREFLFFFFFSFLAYDSGVNEGGVYLTLGMARRSQLL